jgi:hypothetical protein
VVGMAADAERSRQIRGAHPAGGNTARVCNFDVARLAILACSSSGTPARISARIFRDWGNVDSLCG